MAKALLEEWQPFYSPENEARLRSMVDSPE
jgi:hypothetical protein